jgi:hypothetical protein
VFSFSLENRYDQLAKVFRTIELRRYEDVLEIDEIDPIINHYLFLNDMLRIPSCPARVTYKLSEPIWKGYSVSKKVFMLQKTRGFSFVLLDLTDPPLSFPIRSRLCPCAGMSAIADLRRQVKISSWDLSSRLQSATMSRSSIPLS